MYQTEIDRVIKETQVKMDAAIEGVKKQFSTIRTGRAHPKLLDGVKVDYYGTMTPLKQLANISTPEPRQLAVQPWDKNAMDPIEKAIAASDLGITPTNDGKVLRLTMPQLTAERRQELVKVLHKMAEEGRIAVRNARHYGNDEATKAEKENKMTEDDKFDTKDKIQKATDKHIQMIDDLLKEKEHEIKD